jgi:dihydrofolate reductase
MISIIVARDKQRVIGKSGDLPWNIPADLRRFKEITSGNVVVMGRGTYESIGRPLPNRTNIVITGKESLKDSENLFFRNNYEDAIILATQIASEENCKIYVIGGSSVYAEAISDPKVDELLVTLINHEFEGDRFFPFTSPSDWELLEVEKNDTNTPDSYELAFLRYKRREKGTVPESIFYYPSSRSAEQTKKMQDIESVGICPFCPEWLPWYHETPIDTDLQFNHWVVTHNDNPYEGTVLDMLLISKQHTIHFSKLCDEAKAEFGIVIASIAEKYKLFNYAVGMRVGPVSMVSGSVNHLHSHIKVGDVYNDEHEPIKFKMSNKPQENKPPETY